ncbi:MAG: CPBP family intramembrane glutamic endopeptidase, partial [Clostridia bacterium]
LIICGLLAVLFIYQMVSFAISKKYQASMKAQMDSKKASGSLYNKTVNNLIPRTKKEKTWFFFTALTAGICEEIVFRGFLLFLVGALLPATSPYFLVGMIGVLFGSAHFYQGVRGVCKTAAIGLLFGFLYVCTDSLYPCILLHFLFDISSVFLYPSTAIEAKCE